MEHFFLILIGLIAWAFEYLSYNWKESVVAALAIIVYKQTKTALAERRSGEEQILKRLEEVESRIKNVQYQLNQTNQAIEALRLPGQILEPDGPQFTTGRSIPPSVRP